MPGTRLAEDVCADARPELGSAAGRRPFRHETTSYSYVSIRRAEPGAASVGVCCRYGFDLDSNRTEIVENGVRVASYVYRAAAIDRLASATQAGVTRVFAYNADGDTTGRGADSLGWDGWGRHSGGSFGGQSIGCQSDPVGFRRQPTGGTVQRLR